MRDQVVRAVAAMLLCSVAAASGCAHRAGEKPEAARMDAATPRVEVEAQDSAYLQSLRQKVEQWNVAIASRLESVQKEIDEVDRRWSSLRGPAEQEYLNRRKQLLVEYQSSLEAVLRMQLDLGRKANALQREPVYGDLLALYLRCLSLEEGLKQEASLFSGQAALSDDMRQLFLDENFAAVVSRYAQYTSRFPDQDPGPEAQLRYALALERLGRSLEALQAASRVSASPLSVDCTNAALLAEAAALLTKNGRQDEALALRQHLLHYYQSQQEEYARMQSSDFLSVPAVDYGAVQKMMAQASELFAQGGSFSDVYRLCTDALTLCPDRSCQRDVQAAMEGLVSRTAANVDQQLNQIDLFIQQGRLEDARQLLATLEPLLENGIYPPLISEKQASIRQRKEAVFGSESSWQAEEEQQKFDAALKLLESQKYQEAIALFNQLSGGPFAVDAAEKKRLAVDELARLNRTRAGNLFLQARQTQDPKLKKKYLLDSYVLLKDTLLKYPENQYAEKIRRNLEGVQTEIDRLYPGELLPKPAPSGGLQPGAMPPAGTTVVNDNNP